MSQQLKLAFPCVHLNGTSKAELVKSLEEMYAALDGVYVAAKKTVPNMRDYYPLKDGEKVFAQAGREHMARLTKVDDLMKEVEAIIGEIEKQE